MFENWTAGRSGECRDLGTGMVGILPESFPFANSGDLKNVLSLAGPMQDQENIGDSLIPRPVVE